jgi:hypothetical protein
MLRSLFSRFFGSLEAAAPAHAPSTTVLYASFEAEPAEASNEVATTATIGSALLDEHDTTTDDHANAGNRLPRDNHAPKDSRLRPRVPKRRQRERRFANVFVDMSPHEARLLFCVHRRSLRSLAAESPAVLHRDLHRFTLSSDGQKLLVNGAAPTLKAVQSWVRQARERAALLAQPRAFQAEKLPA